MPNSNSSTPNTETAKQTKLFDLVVIGAGAAGLNALFAATQYLPQSAQVLLIDKKSKPGGMWNTTYDYVRLHQPHSMFTVGNLKWNLNKPNHYLAKRDEIQTHLESSLALINNNVNLEVFFGHTVISCKETLYPSMVCAEVTYHLNGTPNAIKTVHAKRAIHAPGLNYQVTNPLTLSSKQVLSITPQDLTTTVTQHPNAPVYIVGGGKTGMDTILATLSNSKKCIVSLINGRGTSFFNRTKYLPNGIKRWTSGMLFSHFFRDMALNFNGDNEAHMLSHFRQTYATDPSSPNSTFLFGLQSEDEHIQIQSNLSQILEGYLEDVQDTKSGPVILMRNGETHAIAAGSIMVNCTGSFFRAKNPAEAKPIISPNGVVLSINLRCSFHFLTNASAFFAAHLMYRDALLGNGFYIIDHEQLFRKNRDAWVGAAVTQACLHYALAQQVLPISVLSKCGIDLDLWYPLPHRLLGLLQWKASARKNIDHCRASLDRIAERFEVTCKALR